MTCKRIFNTSRNLTRHAKDCSLEVRERFKGGKYRRKKTIFEELDDIDICVPEPIRNCPWFSTFDFESLQITDDKVINGRRIISRHEPATFSICSNIPGHTEAVHKRSFGNTQVLIDELIIEIMKQQETFSILMRERYQHYIVQLGMAIETLKQQVGDKNPRKRKLNANPQDKIRNATTDKLIKLRDIQSKLLLRPYCLYRFQLIWV